MTKIKLRASVGRLRRNKGLDPYEADYLQGMKASVKAVIDNLQDFIEQLEDVTPQLIMNAMAKTYEKARVYAPLDTGELRASSYLKQDKTKKYPRVLIGFGNAGKPYYAAFVHERTDIRHRYPTRSKFLSTALEEDQAIIQKRIISEIKVATGEVGAKFSLAAFMQAEKTSTEKGGKR